MEDCGKGKRRARWMLGHTLVVENGENLLAGQPRALRRLLRFLLESFQIL